MPAAFTAVDACESEPDRAYRGQRPRDPPRRRGGPPRSARTSPTSRPTTSSTARSTRPYVEWDAPEPALGLRALQARRRARARPGRDTIVRTSWVCGRDGANMVKTVLRLVGRGRAAALRRRPAREPDDRGRPRRGPSSSSPSARRPGVFHVTNQGATTWYGFARAVVGLARRRSRAGRADLDRRARARPARRRARRTRCSTTPRSACRAGRSCPTGTQAITGARRRAHGVSRGGIATIANARRRGRRQPRRRRGAARAASRACRAPASRRSSSSTTARRTARSRVVAGGRPAVRLVPPGRNLGYGAAANRGARSSTGSCLLVCNPDLVVDAGAVGRSSPRSTRDGDVAVAGPMLVESDGSVYPSARAFPTLGGLARARLRRSVLARTTAGHAGTGCSVPTSTRPTSGLGLGCLLPRPPRSPSRASAASTSATSCTSRTSTSAGGCAAPAGGCATSPRRASSTCRAGRRPAAPTRMLVAHHRSTWRFADRTTEGRERLVLPLVALALGIRLVVAWLSTLSRPSAPAEATNAPCKAQSPPAAPCLAGDRVERCSCQPGLELRPVSRDSFSRRVARAAAIGGSRSYRSRTPWGLVLDRDRRVRDRSGAHRVQPPRTPTGRRHLLDDDLDHPGQHHAAAAHRPLAGRVLAGHLRQGGEPAEDRESDLGHHHPGQRRHRHPAGSGGCQTRPSSRGPTPPSASS